MKKQKDNSQKKDTAERASGNRRHAVSGSRQKPQEIPVSPNREERQASRDQAKAEEDRIDHMLRGVHIVFCDTFTELKLLKDSCMYCNITF